MTAMFKLSSFDHFVNKIDTLIDRNRSGAKQTHLLWTVVGLLVVQPNEGDYLYYHQRREETEDSAEAPANRASGDYFWSQLISFSDIDPILSEIYAELVSELLSFENYGNKFGTYREAQSKENRIVIARLTRELRFILLGCVATNYKIPLLAYQYLVFMPTADNLMMRNGFGNVELGWFDHAQQAGELLRYEEVHDKFRNVKFSKVSAVSYFGRFYVNIRSSVMLWSRFGQQNSATQSMGAASSRIALADSANNMRKISLDRQLSIQENSKLNVEVGISDTPEDARKIVDSAIALSKRTSIVNALSPTVLDKTNLGQKVPTSWGAPAEE